MQAKLVATGLFTSVDIINVTTGGTGTPTLPQLQAYDALICYTNSTPANNVAWRDVLADYVDAGGGVVVTVSANSTTTAGRNIGGRWQTGYEVILDQSGNLTGHQTLGTVHVPSHPVMANVVNFDGRSSSYRATGTALEVGSTLIASWSDGKVLVAEGANPQRIDLGFYPPSSDCGATGWVSSGDGDLLMANALVHVAGAGGCTGSITNYCTSSTTTSGCNPSIAATGVPSAAASSGFTLSCANVEGQKSGLIFYGLGPNAAPWATGSTSVLCVKAPTQRTATQSSGGTVGACDGAISVDFLAFMAANPGALGQPIAAGQQYYAQCWFRDPPAPKTTNLSDGVSFVLCP